MFLLFNIKHIFKLGLVLSVCVLMGCPPPMIDDTKVGKKNVVTPTPNNPDDDVPDTQTVQVWADTPSGTYFSNVNVFLFSNPQDAKIYYTLDPNQELKASEDFLYTPNTALNLSFATQLKVMALKNDVKDSKTYTYGIEKTNAGISFDFLALRSDKDLTVSIQKENFIQDVYYTENDSSKTPDDTEQKYSNPIPLNVETGKRKSVTLRAIGYDALGKPGPIIQETFELVGAGPGINYEIQSIANDGKAHLVITTISPDFEFYTQFGTGLSHPRVPYVESMGFDFYPNPSLPLHMIAVDRALNIESTMEVNQAPPQFQVTPHGTSTQPYKFIPTISNTQLSLSVQHDLNTNVYYAVNRNDQSPNTQLTPTKQSSQIQGQTLVLERPKTEMDPVTIDIYMRAYDSKGFPSAIQHFQYHLDGKPPILLSHTDGGNLCGMSGYFTPNTSQRTFHGAAREIVPITLTAVNENATLFYTEDGSKPERNEIIPKGTTKKSENSITFQVPGCRSTMTAYQGYQTKFIRIIGVDASNNESKEYGACIFLCGTTGFIPSFEYRTFIQENLINCSQAPSCEKLYFK